MYTFENFKTKKALKEAVAAGEKLRVYQPGGVFSPPAEQPYYTGETYLEGPHYPEPHRWYAVAVLVNGVIVKVK